MTSVDDFVRTNILTFPSIFPHRNEVLHHALCVLGTGYKWGEDGTLVNEFDNRPLWTKEDALAKLEENLEQYDSVEIRELIGNTLRKDIERSALIVEEVDARVNERGQIVHFGAQNDFINAHVPLMNVPDNAPADWKEACEEMKILAIKAGWKL